MRGQWEPPFGGVVVRPVRAHCSERVRVRWTLPDGSVTTEDYTAPPLEVVTVRRREAADRRLALGVVDE
jgi:hypothetical protein